VRSWTWRQRVLPRETDAGTAEAPVGEGRGFLFSELIDFAALLEQRGRTKAIVLLSDRRAVELEHANRFDVNGPVHSCTVSMLLWKKPGEQRSGFFFGQAPGTFSKRTTQF
jgi:hypothetical protein